MSVQDSCKHFRGAMAGYILYVPAEGDVPACGIPPLTWRTGVRMMWTAQCTAFQDCCKHLLAAMRAFSKAFGRRVAHSWQLDVAADLADVSRCIAMIRWRLLLESVKSYRSAGAATLACALARGDMLTARMQQGE